MMPRTGRRSFVLVAWVAAVCAWPAGAVRPAKGAMTDQANRPGLGCGHGNAAVPVLQRRARVAGYYDHFLALVGTQVLEWRLGQAARVAFEDAVHVSVADQRAYAIDTGDRLHSWTLGGSDAAVELDQVALASAGASGVMAIRCDGSLWQRRPGAGAWQRIAPQALHAWVGDSADYYIDDTGTLFASGKAHRGQYGDGRLTEAAGWTAVAQRASFVVAHTGHAVHLRDDGAVLGTGGNRFGPLGTHGLGDKADRWAVIFDGASQIATGSRHTLALRADGALFTWGGADGVVPRRVLSGVAAVAGGLDGSAAVDIDHTVWSWAVGQAPARLALPSR